MILGQTKEETRKEFGYGILPFGKYVGHSVSEVDDKYLLFLIDYTNLHGDLKDAVEEEVEKRCNEKDCFGMFMFGSESCAKCPWAERCAALDEDSIYF